MTKEELLNISGGSTLNASWLNAIARGIETVYNLGRSFGTAVRMLIKGSRC